MSIITVTPTTVVVVTTTTAGHVAAMIGPIGKSNLNAKCFTSFGCGASL